MTDYFAPAFSLEVDGAIFGSDLAHYVMDVSVVSEPDTLDHFSLTLANPFPELPWTHGDYATTFAPGAGIAISMGYVDEVADLFDGEVTAISPSFPESGLAVVRVQGYTRLHWLKGPTRTRTFVKRTDRQIVQQVASDLSLSVELSNELTEQYEYVVQYNQTDLAFLIERARRLNHQVSVDGTKLTFVKAETDATPLSLAWGNPQLGTPLRSFTPTLNTLEPLTKVTVKGWNQKLRQAIVGTYPESSGGSSTGAAVAANAGRDAQLTVTKVPVKSKNEAKKIAETIYRRHLEKFIVANGTTIGTPSLRAGGALSISGLGDVFNGSYRVAQATHTISASGYTTSFVARKEKEG